MKEMVNLLNILYDEVNIQVSAQLPDVQLYPVVYEGDGKPDENHLYFYSDVLIQNLFFLWFKIIFSYISAI